MPTATGKIDEILTHTERAARISCAPGMVPAPGQYLLAHTSADLLPVPLFLAESHPAGFYAAAPLPVAWQPGATLHLRGPFGRGFSLPTRAARVALATFTPSAGALLPLLDFALKHSAAVTLLSDHLPAQIPPRVEILPLSALPQAALWAGYLALHLTRADLQTRLPALLPPPYPAGFAQALLQTEMPCGGMAECGVCALRTRRGVRLICKDGPVFDLREIQP
jgi:dihydroorotate dehydrogenase electron transfer subunit